MLTESSFQEGLCGGKSRNLATLRSKAPSGVDIPASLVLPFGTFERVLATPDNKQPAADLQALLSGLVRLSTSSSHGNESTHSETFHGFQVSC